MILTALVKCLDLVLTRFAWIWQEALCDISERITVAAQIF